MNDRLLQKTRCNDKQVFLYLADYSSHDATMTDTDDCLCMLKILLQKKKHQVHLYHTLKYHLV